MGCFVDSGRVEGIDRLILGCGMRVRASLEEVRTNDGRIEAMVFIERSFEEVEVLSRNEDKS